MPLVGLPAERLASLDLGSRRSSLQRLKVLTSLLEGGPAAIGLAKAEAAAKKQGW